MRSGNWAIRAIKLSFQEVFSNYSYIALALLFSAVSFTSFIWIVNSSFIAAVMASPFFSLSDTFILMIRLLGGIVTNYDFWGAALVIFISLLFGFNMSLLIYSLQNKLSNWHNSGVSGAAFFSGFLGAGCASCGTYLLGATFASATSSGMLFMLPLDGKEFLLFSAFLLIISMIWLCKGIQMKNVCALD